MKATISIDHLARIEGHGNIRVVIKDGKLETCQAEIVEPARFFEAMVRGRRYDEVPYIASRICGICSATHVVTDILAIERIFGIRVSERTKALRELMLYGSFLQNHATHLFVFAAPDFVGENSMFPLATKQPELFNKALELKALGNELCSAVGGRSIHPITAVVGGFTHEMAAEEYTAFAERMDAMVPFAVQLADLFHGFAVPDIITAGDMLCMVDEGRYPISDSRTVGILKAGLQADADDMESLIEEYQVDHSAAFFARVRETGAPFMVGALARINAGWSNLSKTAKVSAAKVGLRPPEFNPFLNNVAQAVEIVDALVRCAEICRKLADGSFGGSSEPRPFTVKAGKAVGFTEAPRGAVFHQLELDEEGRVVKAALITPTSQNLANMEADMRVLAEALLAKGADEDVIRKNIEILVRAYDPCLSCSVH